MKYTLTVSLVVLFVCFFFHETIFIGELLFVQHHIISFLTAQMNDWIIEVTVMARVSLFLACGYTLRVSSLGQLFSRQFELEIVNYAPIIHNQHFSWDKIDAD